MYAFRAIGLRGGVRSRPHITRHVPMTLVARWRRAARWNAKRGDEEVCVSVRGSLLAAFRGACSQVFSESGEEDSIDVCIYISNVAQYICCAFYLERRARCG